MSIFKKLFRQTFVYGLATVLPRVLGVILVPIYTGVLSTEVYGVYVSFMALLILGNVVLSYGMETAFFRFINKESDQKNKVESTVLTSLTISTISFLIIGLLCRNFLGESLGFKVEYIIYGLWIMALDALVVLPFVWYRANERPMRYAIIKIINVVINLSLNIFFLIGLPELINSGYTFFNSIYLEDQITYVFISNLIASGVTFLLLIPLYTKIKFGFDVKLWKSMMKYAMPVLISGVAFSINEAFDKWLLRYLLPENIADAEAGIYGACYKIGVFMTLFSTAFRLGIEPFFFNHAKEKNAKETYANITLYFTVLGSLMMLGVVVFADILKLLIIKDESYWEGMVVVPIILLANLCLGVYHSLSVWYKINDQTRFGAIISVIGAIITIILNYMLIPIYSYLGSAIATLAAYGTMMILSYLLGRKYYPIPYNIKKIGLYFSTSILFSVLTFYVYDRNYVVGVPLLLVFLVILYISEKKVLKQILRR
ncbi:oligosaccharide flippase family protein [Aquimarina rhabdastrellae]